MAEFMHARTIRESQYAAAQRGHARQSRYDGLTTFRSSGLPKRHRDVAEAVEGRLIWPSPAKVAECERIVFEERGMLLAVGRRGPGKTQLAACMAYDAAVVRGMTVMYRRLADLMGEIKHECFECGGSDARVMARLGRIGFLILDECQDRFESDFEDKTLTRLLDHRYGEKRPTMLIANLSAEEFQSSLGPSVISRAQEGGGAVVFDWASFRAEHNQAG